MYLTVTSAWVIYEIIVLIWTEFLSRKLSLREKALLVLLGVAVAIYGGYSEHKESVESAALSQKVADTQAECESTRRNEMNLQATVVAVATKMDANPTPDEIKAAAAQLFSVARSASITTHGSFGGEVVIRDKTGKVVQRSTIK